MEQSLVDSLYDAYQYLRCIEKYDELAEKYQRNSRQHREKYRQLKGRQAGNGFRARTVLLFLSPMIFVMLVILFAGEGAVAKIFSIVMLTLLITGPFIASKKSRESAERQKEAFRAEAVEYWQTTGGPAEKSNQEVVMRIANEKREFVTKNASVTDLLPADYQNTSACGFFFTSIANKRADTLKEAINLYEETLHRMRLEYAAQDLANAVRNMQYDVMNQMEAINVNIDRTNSRLRDIENLEFYNTFFK